MKRRRLLVLAPALAAPTSRAKPPPDEQARIDRLIRALGQRTDAVFIRNGKAYSCAQAAAFLQGKMKWHIDKLSSVHEFIEQVGTRSDASGKPYHFRLADGRVVPSADFLRQELAKLDRR
ncbi:MAG: DUF5329 family protein [Burkholderiales bacterium]|nr:DUF5329 family protein [Burkholderiales bacterium]